MTVDAKTEKSCAVGLRRSCDDGKHDADQRGIRRTEKVCGGACVSARPRFASIMTPSCPSKSVMTGSSAAERRAAAARRSAPIRGSGAPRAARGARSSASGGGAHGVASVANKRPRAGAAAPDAPAFVRRALLLSPSRVAAEQHLARRSAMSAALLPRKVSASAAGHAAPPARQTEPQRAPGAGADAAAVAGGGREEAPAARGAAGGGVGGGGRVGSAPAAEAPAHSPAHSALLQGALPGLPAAPRARAACLGAPPRTAELSLCDGAPCALLLRRRRPEHARAPASHRLTRTRAPQKRRGPAHSAARAAREGARESCVRRKQVDDDLSRRSWLGDAGWALDWLAIYSIRRLLTSCSFAGPCFTPPSSLDDSGRAKSVVVQPRENLAAR